MNIVLVGLGAVGGVYATALKDHNIPFKIALDPARLERYKATPFLFNDQEYTFEYFTPAEIDANADLIIIATKWDGFQDALQLITPIVGDNTSILPLLNGISSEPTAAKKFGWDKVLHSYFIGHTASRENRSVNQDGKYVTVFGEKTNDPENPSPRVKKICQLFDQAQIKYRIDPDMQASLWQKFVINIGLNQSTAYYKKPYGEVQSNPEYLAFTERLMKEAAQIALHLGIANAQNLVKNGLETLQKMRKIDSSSMLQDVIAGRKTEVDLFAAEVCRQGKQYNIPTPENQKILDHFTKS